MCASATSGGAQKTTPSSSRACAGRDCRSDWQLMRLIATLLSAPSGSTTSAPKQHADFPFFFAATHPLANESPRPTVVARAGALRRPASTASEERLNAWPAALGRLLRGVALSPSWPARRREESVLGKRS